MTKMEWTDQEGMNVGREGLEIRLLTCFTRAGVL